MLPSLAVIILPSLGVPTFRTSPNDTIKSILTLPVRAESKTTVDEERVRLSNVVKDIRTTQIPALKNREMEMLAKIENVRATESPVIATARDEIARIRKSADDQVKASNELIQQLREKIKVDGGSDIDANKKMLGII